MFIYNQQGLSFVIHQERYLFSVSLIVVILR